jgi:hypothetical protein
MYIKLNNGQIEKYPYSDGDLRKDNPNTSFPSKLSTEILSEFNVYEVIRTLKPQVTFKQNIVEGTPINEDGVWKQNWVISDKTLEEIESIITNLRLNAYREESDPLFFKWQRGEVEKQEWLDKVNEIKQRWV